MEDDRLEACVGWNGDYLLIPYGNNDTVDAIDDSGGGDKVDCCLIKLSSSMDSVKSLLYVTSQMKCGMLLMSVIGSFHYRECLNNGVKC